MSDETTTEGGEVVEIRKLDKNGNPVRGPIGRKLTPEALAKMQEGRRRAREEAKRLREADKIISRLSPREIEERAIEKLTPAAIKALEEIITDRKSVCCEECGYEMKKLSATPSQVISAAKVVIEHTEGRPAQKIQVEKVDVIEYRLAQHEPPPAQTA